MAEQFKAEHSVRSTFPWAYLVGIWAMVALAAGLVAMGWTTLAYFAYGVAIGVAIDYGKQRYRWDRYRKAKKAFEAHMDLMKLREKE